MKQKNYWRIRISSSAVEDLDTIGLKAAIQFKHEANVRTAFGWQLISNSYLCRMSSGARWRSSERTLSCHSTGTALGKKHVLLSQAW